MVCDMTSISQPLVIAGFRSETITVKGVRLHYWIGGNPEGQPVLPFGMAEPGSVLLLKLSLSSIAWPLMVKTKNNAAVKNRLLLRRRVAGKQLEKTNAITLEDVVTTVGI